MEFSTESANRRSLLRRSAPWALALGLFSGGGYGVYRYAAPVWQDYNAPPSAEFLLAHASGGDESATTTPARAAVNQLFGSDMAKAPDADRSSDESLEESPRYGDRYGAAAQTFNAAYAAAPPLPPPTTGAEDSAAGAVATTNSTVAADPSAGGQFSAAVPNYRATTGALNLQPNSAPTTPAVNLAGYRPGQANESSSAAADYGDDSSSAPDDDGRQTSGNPLRDNARPAATTDAEANARAAFSDGQPHVPAAKPRAFETSTPAANASPSRSLPVGDDRQRGFAIPDSSSQFSSAAGSAAPLAIASLSSAKPLVASSGDADAARVRTPAPAFAMPPKSPGSVPSSGDGDYADARGLTPTPGLAAAEGAGRPGERSLEGLQSPVITIQKIAPAEVQVGKRCTFAVRVANTGQRAASQIQIRDETPLGAQLIGTAPKAIVNGAHVQWDLGTLSPGEERVVEMELIPTAEGELGSVATVTFAAQASAKARSTRPELALRLASGPRVMLGQQQIVEIEVSNPGTGPATGVMLLASVPQGVRHEAGPALEFEVGTLQPGETRRLELQLTAEKAGVISNMMTARADANLEVDASCQFEVIAPELEVSVDGPQRRYLDRPATYTVSIANPGTATAKEVQLVTQLSKGLQFVKANNMGEYDAATHSVYWSLAELPPSEKGTVELTALPIEAGEQSLQVASRAQQGLEDRTEARTVVEGLAALSFEVKARDQMIEVGGQTTYDIRVTNQGSKAATNVQVAAVTPPGLRPAAADGAANHAIQGDRIVFSPLAQLPPKGEASFRVEVQGLRPGDQRLRVEVTSDDVREPIVKQESTRVYADE